MDKGIRPYCNIKFVEMLATRTNTRAGNTAFRKTVMCDVMEQFGVTLASASTHYNHSFQCAPIPVGEYREVEFRGRIIKMGPGLGVDPALLVGLGREPDKKGGRKPKAKVEVVAAPAVVETAAAPEVLLLGYTPTAETAPVEEAPAAEFVLPAFQVVQEAIAQQGEMAAQAAEAQMAAAEVAVAVMAEELVAEAPALFNVLTKKGNKLVQEGVTEQVARDLITAADRAKKAKLIMEAIVA